tara:strand:+ start:361 stop:2088 length:1728 start_codon:yes stop_codon:yes gene_type:complete
MPDYEARLSEFRQAMKHLHCDAFIIPQGDIWDKENPEASQNRFLYMSGLDASAGFVVVTQEQAAVLIDFRYKEFAKDNIDHSVYEVGYYTDTPPEEWLIERLKINAVIGYDPWLHTRKEAKRMQKACNEAGVILLSVDTNPVDQIWQDRPTSLDYTAIPHDIRFTGLSVDDKIKLVAEAIEKNEADSIIITAADSIAWLLNMRTLENSQSPGIRGFAIFQSEHKKLTVFTDVDCSAFDSSEAKHFEVDFLSLEEFPMAVSYFERVEQVVQIADTAPDWFTEHLNAPASEIIRKTDPCEALKASKNEIEQKGIRESHIRDGKAVQKVIEWVKTTRDITEKDVADKLYEERLKSNMFRGVSFDTISGWNANGANIHRKFTETNNTKIQGSGFLLLDSGAQYDDGTTDITRTIPVGTVTEDMRHKYTLVLKGHIALATAIFPEGATGAQLDALARAPLWMAGIDYAHGTGHGVGYFLNVHEGPYGISPRSTDGIKEGMLLSNEPGYYKEGVYGIRLENLILVRKYKVPDETGNETGKKLLCFETVTKVPFEDSCIDRDMLTEAEKEWLDDYNASCKLA